MPPELNGTAAPDPAKGLPPVVAPSGRFIAQLFLVPGLIVAGAVAVLLGFSWLAGGPKSPEVFLRDLDSSNSDIRWRTASDLAQVLKRDERLASDPGFGLALADRLAQALRELERAERGLADAGTAASAHVAARERKEAAALRSYVQYLCASLGSLRTPVGGPVLAGIARQGLGRDPKTDALLRRQAVWALAALGDNLGRFDQLPEGRRSQVLEFLDQAAALSNGASSEDIQAVLKASGDLFPKYVFSTNAGELADWTRGSAAYLRKSGPFAVIPALLDCAEADDPFLRQQVAHALTFWDGTAAENQRIEAALLRLARDDGHGTAIEVGEGD